MEWELVANEKRAKAAEPDMEENIETVHTDYPLSDSKPAAKKPPFLDTTMIDEEEYDDEEGEDPDEIQEEMDDDDNPGLVVTDQHSFIQYTTKDLDDSMPNSLTRHVLAYNLRHGPTKLGDLNKFIEHWTNVAKDPVTFMDALRTMYGCGDGKPPIMFIALDQDTNAISILHHIGLFRCENRQPQLAAFADDRHHTEKAPQLVFLEAKEICNTVDFSIPSNLTEEEIAKLDPKGATLISPSRKPKITSTLIIPLPCHWAPFFLDDPSPMSATTAHLSLMRFASSLQGYPSYEIVQNFAWGLITSKSAKKTQAHLAVPLRPPRLTQNILAWRETVLLGGIFNSIDLTSNDAQQTHSTAKPVNLSPDSAVLATPPSSWPVNLSSDSAAFEQPRAQPINQSTDSAVLAQPPSSRHVNLSPDIAAFEQPRAQPINQSTDSAVLAQPPSSRPVNLSPDSAAFKQPPNPVPVNLSSDSTVSQPAPSNISSETTLLLQATLQTNQAMASAMTAFFEANTKGKPKPTSMLDDDSVEGEGTSRPSKFTARKAAPFHGWARIKPGHLFKTLPPLFSDLVEGSTTERHGIIAGFFSNLEKENPRTFAGFQPSDDLLDDIAKSKFGPPKGYGTKYHRGLGPMAFAIRSLQDLDTQTENRDLRDTYSEHLSLTLADAKKLESATPLVPMDFEAFLLLLSRFSDFHKAAFGPDCDLPNKINKIIRNLTLLRNRISRSPAFMPSRAPSIIWALTLATQEFYAEFATHAQFEKAKETECDQPFVEFNIDVGDLSKLTITEACDLPAFLRRNVAPPTPPAAPSPYVKQVPPSGSQKSSTKTQNQQPRSQRNGPGDLTNPNFCAAFRTQLHLLPPGEAREKVGLRNLLKDCPGETYSTLMRGLGTDNSTCLRYHVLGSCGLQACTKTHAPVNFPPGGADAVCKMLQPGFAKLIANS